MKWLDHLEEWLIATFMGAATLITFIAVVHRYAVGFQSPLQGWLLGIDMSWAQEATIYLFVWMAKFGAAYGVRTGIHVGVDVLINRLDPKKRRVFVLFGLLALVRLAAAAPETAEETRAIDARVVRVKLDGLVDLRIRQGSPAVLVLGRVLEAAALAEWAAQQATPASPAQASA